MTLARWCLVAALYLISSQTFATSQEGYPPDAGKVGLPLNGTFSGGSIDSVQVNNGNLHVDIPLLHLPGIGMDTVFHFVYDNQVFTVTQVPYTFGPSGPPTSYWQLITMSRYMASVNDPLAGYFKIGEHNEHWECGNPVGWIGNLTNIEYMSFSDPNGTSHAFPESGYESATVAPCVSGYSPLSSFSNDAAGYDLTTNSSGVVTSLIDKRGTHYTLGGNEGYGIVSAGEQNPNQPQNPIIGSTSLNFYPITKIEDSNGNTLASNANGIIDTVGRAITETAGPPFASSSLMVEATGKQISKITYYDQNNQPQSVTINYGSVSIDLTQACNGALPALCGPQVGTSASTITVQLPTSIALQNGDEFQISYVPNSLGEVQSITLPTGGTISYTYSANPNDLAGSIGRQVTSRTVTANGQTSTWGFNGYIVTDPNSNDTVYTCNLGWPCYMTNEVIYKGSHTSGTPLVTRSTTYTQYGCAFLPTAEKFTWNASGQTTETDTTYDSFSAAQQFCEINNTYTSATSRGNPYSRMIYDYGFGSHGSLLTNTQFSYWHDTHSNYVTANIVDRLSQVSIYNSTTVSQSSLVAQSTTSYDSFTSGGQTGLVATTGTTQHDYANYGTGTTLRGLPTSITKYTGPNTPAVTNYVNYNDLGNETVSTDGLGNSTTYTYGGQNAFLASTTRPSTNGVAHVTTENHDVNTGLLMSRKDENQNTTTYTYDSRMRPLSMSFPDLGSTTFAYPDPNHINKSVLMNSTQTNVLQQILDGLGRTQETIEATGISGQQIYTYTSYDALGRKSQQWNPTYCDPPTSNCGESTWGITTYQYDALSRLASAQNPDGSSKQWCYDGTPSAGQSNCHARQSSSGEWIDAADEAGNDTQRSFDALGRLTSAMEPNGTGALPSMETDYAYDAVGNLLQVDQYGGAKGNSQYTDHQRRFSYDGLSRLLSAFNPETGTTSYSYDANGNVLTKNDARGITTTYNYDALKRLTKKSYSDGTTPLVLFVYDTSSITFSATQKYTTSNVVGRLSVICVDIPGACQSMTAYSYDTMGRVIQSLNSTPSNPTTGAVYSVSAGYDLAGDLTSLIYPDGRVVSQNFDLARRLQQEQFASADGTSVGYNYFSSPQYFPDSSLMAATYGNGAAETIAKNNRFQATFITLNAPQSTLQSQVLFSKQYCYISGCGTGTTNNGNIFRITDVLNGNKTQNFSYDTLNRLSSFNSTDSTMVQTFTTDPFGNISAVAPGTLQNNLSFNAANNQINSGNYGSDPGGNLTSVPNFVGGGAAPITYDAENRITNYNSGAGTYLYDADGDRIRKNVGSGYTEYIEWNGSPLAEIDNNGNWSDHIYANGQRIATSTAFDRDLGVNATFSGTGQSATWTLPLTGYPIQSGDVLCFRQTQSGGVVGGIHFGFTDGTNADGATDENGQPMAADSDQSGTTWQLRTIKLSSYAGKTIASASIVAGPQTPAGTWSMFFAKASIVSNSGTVTQIYNQALSISLSYSGTSGVTGASANVGTYSGHITQPVETTDYYTGDHLGSARVEVAAEGWPVSAEIYYPFGQEYIQPSTPNKYKFTGKERDTESGNDYFGARYYASSMGRWLSPDTDFTLTRILPNPQRWNRYAYVINNPLVRLDPNGLADYYVFLNYLTTPGAQKAMAWLAETGRTPDWNAIAALAAANGNRVFFFGGFGQNQPEANETNLQTALQQGQFTMLVGDSHLTDNGYGPQADGVLMGNQGVVGNQDLFQHALDVNDPLISTVSANGGTVADFSCGSSFAGSVFPGVDTFIGIYGGPVNQAGTILGAAAFLRSMVTNQGFPAAFAAANGEIYGYSNNFAGIAPTEPPQVERDTSLDNYQITE